MWQITCANRPFQSSSLCVHRHHFCKFPLAGMKRFMRRFKQCSNFQHDSVCSVLYNREFHAAQRIAQSVNAHGANSRMETTILEPYFNSCDREEWRSHKVTPAKHWDIWSGVHRSVTMLPVHSLMNVDRRRAQTKDVKLCKLPVKSISRCLPVKNSLFHFSMTPILAC